MHSFKTLPFNARFGVLRDEAEARLRRRVRVHRRAPLRFLRRARAYRPIMQDGGSHLRDEVGIIDEHAKRPPLQPLAALQSTPLLQLGRRRVEAETLEPAAIQPAVIVG